MADHKKLFQWAMIFIALVVSLLIIRPFIAALAFAAVLAYLAHPAHNWLQTKIKKLPSAVLLTFLVVISILCFIAWGLNFLLTEVSQAYINLASTNFNQIFPQEIFGGTVEDIIRLVFSKFIGYLSTAISKLPGVLLSFFVFIMAFFYFLKDGKKLWLISKKLLPLKKTEKKNVIRELEKYAYAFIHVQLLVAVVQGVVAAVGFYLFGSPYWILAGFAAAVLSFIPILGPYLVYVPTGIFMAISGNVFAGIGLIVYGLVIGSILDYIVRPYYTGKWAAIHPLVVLVGILGGLWLIGPAGIIIGPLLLLITIAIIKGTSLSFLGRK